MEADQPLEGQRCSHRRARSGIWGYHECNALQRSELDCDLCGGGVVHSQVTT